MIAELPAEIIEKGVVRTVRKFAYICYLLGRYATQVFRTDSGLTPPSGYSYGRYYQSGDPLLQYSESATSVPDLIAQGVILREDLLVTLRNMVQTALNGDVATELPAAVYASMAALMDCCATPVDQIELSAILAGFRPITTHTSLDNVDNEIAWLAARTAVLIRVAALTELARGSARYVPNSSTDALNTRNRIAALMDAEMMRVASWYDDKDYNSLKTLRSAVVADMNARANELQPVVTVTFKDNLPSLVIAQILYGDATREADLTARNDADLPGGNPGFMPLEIEALAQ